MFPSAHSLLRCKLLSTLAFTLATAYALQAATITTESGVVTATVTHNYTHTVTSCTGNGSSFGPCVETVSPPTSASVAVLTPDFVLQPLVPNAVITSAYIQFVRVGATVDSDVQNSYTTTGNITGGYNWPQGRYLSFDFANVALNGISVFPSGNFSNLLNYPGMAEQLMAGGTMSATGFTRSHVYAFDGWQSTTNNFTYTQNRTITNTSPYYMRVTVNYDLGPEVPEPSTFLSGASALTFLAWRWRSKRG